MPEGQHLALNNIVLGADLVESTRTMALDRSFERGSEDDFGIIGFGEEAHVLFGLTPA
ncbi:hypothetical protein ACQE3E_16085 [Methylomonas sp. MED-D]|uniref:hypothetical protein n=1 Tax=unclassified Methylomonas TaxID=2608980 RepID=UPI0028A35F01|nr:hypothetical protein [Methylomonas sp. MV1]MDT4331123.1 hypothetical protein [Methylomonas sp. MV1]